MTTKAKLDKWVIDGIEFEVKSRYDYDYTGMLPAGVVRDPNDSDVFFFSEASLAKTELQQLIDDGYLYKSRTSTACFLYKSRTSTACFYLFLAADKSGVFPGRVPPASGNRIEVETAECCICKRLFPFVDNGGNMIMTHPATGPTYACGGNPPEYEAACDECITKEDDGYDPMEEDLWEIK